MAPSGRQATAPRSRAAGRTVTHGAAQPRAAHAHAARTHTRTGRAQGAHTHTHAHTRTHGRSGEAQASPEGARRLLGHFCAFSLPVGSRQRGHTRRTRRPLAAQGQARTACPSAGFAQRARQEVAKHRSGRQKLPRGVEGWRKHPICAVKPSLTKTAAQPVARRTRTIAA